MRLIELSYQIILESRLIKCLKLLHKQVILSWYQKVLMLIFMMKGELGKGLFSQIKNYVLLNSTVTDLYPVHRLDKMTSGLLIFATNNNSAKIFGELFQTHKIEKYYLAISDKKPTKKQGLIKGDMEKSRRGMFKLMRTQKKPAITQFFSYSIGNKQRYIY